MRILSGSSINNISEIEFENIIKGYQSLIIDIGTGEGDFVYKNAKLNPNNMYIGIDTSADSMKEFSLKSAKKPEKGGLKNVMYVIGNACDLPDILTCKADKIYINLPWGSLRDGIIKGEHDFLSNIRKISKENATLEIRISYCDQYEKQEIHSRQLPELTLAYFNDVIKDIYKNFDIHIKQISVINNEDLKRLDTKWAKKLGFGKQREAYCLTCKITK